MSTPYHSASDFVHKQVDEVLEKNDAWLQEKEEHEKRQRKRG
jgi:Arc/MetJ-type ribon-helix-helix transcriptional regulator